MRIFIPAVLSLFVLPATAPAQTSDQPLDASWTTGLYCESVSPDKRLNNFFIINAEKSQMLVASFNEDKVSFSGSPIALSKTPEELVNRKSGLSLNRKNLQMKWRNRKSTCQITTVDELRNLAETHLTFLLSDNQI